MKESEYSHGAENGLFTILPTEAKYSTIPIHAGHQKTDALSTPESQYPPGTPYTNADTISKAL